MKKILLAAVLSLGAATCAMAAPVITSYDIENASESGYGGWHHTYDGMISPTGNSWADYTGGSGTLNDGSGGVDEQSTQLFRLSPVIKLHLDSNYLIDSLTIFGGNFHHNAIPGELTGFSVTIGSSTVSFDSTDLPTNQDFVSLAGSGLETMGTNEIILSNFTGAWWGMFSIAEITVDGRNAPEVTAVPEPASTLLLGMGMLAALYGGKRRARK